MLRLALYVKSDVSCTGLAVGRHWASTVGLRWARLRHCQGSDVGAQAVAVAGQHFFAI